MSSFRFARHRIAQFTSLWGTYLGMVAESAWTLGSAEMVMGLRKEQKKKCFQNLKLGESKLEDKRAESVE